MRPLPEYERLNDQLEKHLPGWQRKEQLDQPRRSVPTREHDPESEALVNANLLRIARGRTMIIVSHRLSSLTECDQTLVLEKGQVMDIAPHQVLLERCPIYRQLWAQQHRHMDGRGPRGAVTPRLVRGD